MRIKTSIGFPLVVLLTIVAEFLFWGPTLEYRRPLLMLEPWRLFTGHFVHLSLTHAMLNGVALLLLGRLFSDRLRDRDFWTVLGVAPIVISLMFWMLMPELTWYRGLSGTLHALYFAGCVVWFGSMNGTARWLPIAALIGGALKVLLEQPWDASFPFREWLGAAVVPQAHLIGAIFGLGAGFWIKQVRRSATQ